MNKYKIIEKLHESSSTVIYRAEQVIDHFSVILKVLQPENPSPEEFHRFKSEYEITKSFNNSGVISVLSLEEYGNTLMIVEEDIAAESIDTYMKRSMLTLDECLSIAIQTAQNIGHIHAENVIHKNLCPSNILWNTQTGQVKIIDFGIASRLPSESVTLKNLGQLEGTLAYLSPEQTGRINRSIDYRTDLYSLGATLYEMFTGQLPFTASDTIELVHCHIAKTPLPVCEINTDIPLIVSDIIMKLLEKNAEDRYQSALGLKVDLEKCQEHRANKQNMKGLKFELGHNDFSGQFQIPQKLYGRESEINTLLEAFDRVSLGKTEVMIVAGYSGIGKTVLVHEVHKPMTEKRGYFVAGKFDQFKQNIPYYAITQAFNEFCLSLLKERSETLQNWKRKILDAVGINGQVILDVIPDLELVIGAQPAVAEVGPAEAQNRFNLSFLNFFKALCDKEHPLIIFLDDLQWADLPTLNLVNLMMTDSDTHYLLFIGAYRDNEISDVHPLPRILDTIQNQVSFSKIILPPLEYSHVHNLISDSTISSLEMSKSLASVVYEKTGGNPFFVNMFLKAIVRKKLIAFDFDKREWSWDVQRIRSQDITNNVVDMMVDRISQLPIETQQILALAACFGSQFNLKLLSLVYDHSSSMVFDALWNAVLDGLIIPVEDDYKWIKHSPEGDHEARFRFLHDRVQQAAYSFLNEKEKKMLHLKIGRVIRQHTVDDDIWETLIGMVGHFNLGKNFITDSEEKENVCRLNLRAAKKAKLSSAYRPALDFIITGMTLLPDNSWETNYELSLSYYFEKGEIEYLNAQWDDALATFEEISNHVSTLLERCKISEYKATLYRMKNDLTTSLNISVEALSMLGIELKAFPDIQDVEMEIKRCNQMLQGKDTDSLFHLPELTDPLKLQAMALLRECFAPAYFLGSNLIAIIGVRMTEITLRDGNNPHSSVGYIFLSSVTLVVFQNDYDTAYKFGLLSLRLNDDKYQIKAYEALILDMWGSFVCHYKKSVDISQKYLLRGYYSGIENGSYQWAGYCAINILFQSFLGSDTLYKVEEKVNQITPGLSKIDQNMVQYFYAVSASIHNLKEPVEDWSVVPEDYWPHSKEVLKQCRIQNDLLTPFVDAICRLLLANFFSSEKANEYALQAEHYLVGAPGIFLNPVFYFHQSIAYSSTYHLVDESHKEQYVKILSENINRFEAWAQHCPENYLHFYELMRAEYGRIVNAPIEDIMSYYDRAIEASLENNFVQYQALACELASKYYQSIERKIIARAYLIEAHRCYQIWGALVKVQNLESQYPQFLDNKVNSAREVPVVSSPPDTTMDSPSHQQTTSIQLDLESVMKASQILSGEIVLSSLLKKIMHIVIENAGATRGLLILEKDGEWLIEAEGTLDFDNVTVQQAIPIEESEQAPATLINYISRTQESVVLTDATQEGGFTKDAYIIKKLPKSVLGLPILNHGSLNGILYLENNLTTAAFTADRLQVINLLAFQVGISLENARLFEEKQKNTEALMEEVAERIQAEEALNESEERFRKISENAPVLINSFDENGKCLFWNKQCKRTFGWTIEEINEREVAMALFYPDPAVCEEVIRTVTSDPDGNFREWHPVTKDGKILNVMWANFSLPNGQVFSMGHDITERKQAENELKESEAKFKTLVTNNEEIIYMIDKNGIFQLSEGKGLSKLGLKPGEVVGGSVFDIYKDYPEMVLDLKTALKGESLAVEHKVGGVYFNNWFTPHKNSSGEIIGLLGLSIDITERKQAEIELIATQEDLKKSEQRFRAMFEATPLAVDIYHLKEDNRLVLTQINPAAEKMTGIDSSFLIGKSIEEAFPELVSTDIPDLYRAVARGELKTQIYESHYSDDRFSGWYEIAVFNMGENNIGVQVLDITERKKQEVELQNLRNYLANIIDSMPSILIGIDSDSNITQWNNTAEQKTGIATENALNKPLIEVFPSLISEVERIDLAFQTRKVQSNLKQVHIEKGETYCEDITIYPLITQGVEGAVIRIDDVTKEYEVEQQLNQARKMDAIGQLAGGVAHDFNNMLAGIIGAAQLLLNPKRNLDQKSLEFVEMIINASNRAADLTGKLLAFGRKGKIISTSIDIHRIIDDTVSIFNQTIDKKITISLSKNAENPMVTGDDSAMQNSILNLGINASHAMANGGELVIETRNIYLNEMFCNSSPFKIEEGDYIEIDIRDTGCGITPENISKIFEPFFTTKKQGEGTGLGLASVYGTIQDHNGAINVCSEIGEGTVFHIYLPCVADTVKIAGKIEPVSKGVGQVLFVDDEEFIRVTGKYSLEDMGYKVILAENGLEALEIFKQQYQEIDLVIMDMIMPEMNGRETFIKMKEIDTHCKVIISSGFTKDENLSELNEAGLAGFIQKPFREDELSKLLSKVMRITGDN
ncbi:MAG: PAS domain S-box protein [Fibrobacterales bacterium]